MTFTEAVLSLVSGDCVGIRRDNWEDSVVWLMGSESLVICDSKALGDVDHKSRQMFSPSSTHVLDNNWVMVRTHRVEVKPRSTTFTSVIITTDGKVPQNAKFYAEWIE